MAGRIGMQNKRPSVKKNFIYSTGIHVFRIIIPFITAPYLSRVLGADAIGIQSFTVSVQSYFILIATLGTVTYGAREIARNRDNIRARSKIFWEIEILTIATTAFSVIAWTFLIFLVDAYRMYYIILTMGIIAVIFDISWFFNGIEEFKLTVIRSILVKGIGTVCIFVFVKDPNDLDIYILIYSLVTVISNLSLWLYLPRYLVKVCPREFCYKEHFKETMVFFLPTIASSIYTMLDKTLIGILTNDLYQNGYYEQAQKIINLLKSIVYQSLNAVIGVRISYLYEAEQFNEIENRIESSLNYILFMGFGCCFGIMGVAKTFVPLYFGIGYEGVIRLIYVFAPILVIVGVSNCLDTQYYTPFGKQRMAVKYIIIGAVLNFCLNLLAIPQWGAFGAAIASVLAEIIILSFYIKNCGKYGRIGKIFRVGYKKAFAGVGMFILVYELNLLPVLPIVRIIVQLTCGFIVYVLLLLFLRDTWVLGYMRSICNKLRNIIK